MKTPIRFIALGAALFAASMQAQSIVTLPPFVTLSNVAIITNLTAGTLSIDCSRQQNIAVEYTVTPSQAGVTAVQSIYFSPVVVPGEFQTAPALTVNGYVMRIAAATGPTPVVVVTNWNCSGWSRLDVYTISNVTSGGVAANYTNTIRYAVKKNAP